MTTETQKITWRTSPFTDEDIQGISNRLGVSSAIAKLLYSLDITEFDDAQNFLKPSLKLLCQPEGLTDMDKAIDRIEKALLNKERILIHADYDADGVTTASMFKRGFEILGYHVDLFCPNRFKEGYGLNPVKIGEFVEEYDLIISGDTGIKAFEAAKIIHEHPTCDLIVTDHHEPFVYKTDEPTDEVQMALDQAAVPYEFDDETMLLPNCIAVVDQHRLDDTYPNKSMAGVGVAFKTMHALLNRFKVNPIELFKHLDLFAVGSIADLAPQLNKYEGKWNFENHMLCKIGISLMNEQPKPWVKAISLVTSIKRMSPDDKDYIKEQNAAIKESIKIGELDKAEKIDIQDETKFNIYKSYLNRDHFFEEGEKISGTSIGFSIGPTLNAPGRLDDPRPSLDLLLEDDDVEALKKAMALKRINTSRQVQTEEYAKVIKDLESSGEEYYDYGIVVQSENYHSGIAGLIASKLQQHFYRPVIALAPFEKDGVQYLKGSARSIEDIHVLKAIQYVSSKIGFFAYGGHTQAAGMTILADQFDDFRRYFREACMQYDADAFIPKIYYDTELHLSEVDFELIDVIHLFEPFGVGMFKSDTKEPLFCSKKVKLKTIKLQSNGKGANFTVEQDGHSLSCVTFNKGQEFLELYQDELENSPSVYVDILYAPSINEWNGRVTVQLHVNQMRIHEEN